MLELDFSAYLSEPRPGIDEATRATLAWRRISDKPTSIVILRNNAKLPVQIVRIEATSFAGNVAGAGGMSGERRTTVFGVKGHPSDAVPDTDIQHGDRFVVDGKDYRVVDVFDTLGERQAYVETKS